MQPRYIQNAQGDLLSISFLEQGAQWAEAIILRSSKSDTKVSYSQAVYANLVSEDGKETKVCELVRIVDRV